MYALVIIMLYVGREGKDKPNALEQHGSILKAHSRHTAKCTDEIHTWELLYLKNGFQFVYIYSWDLHSPGKCYCQPGDLTVLYLS